MALEPADPITSANKATLTMIVSDVLSSPGLCQNTYNNETVEFKSPSGCDKKDRGNQLNAKRSDNVNWNAERGAGAKLNSVGLDRLKACQDVEIRIPAGQPQHVAGLRRNKRK